MRTTKFPAGQELKKSFYKSALLFCAALLLITGCAARGARRVPADRFDYCFYIDHADITSKRALSLLIGLFRLQAPTPSGAAPILTLPTG
jgi:hypothetical protein